MPLCYSQRYWNQLYRPAGTVQMSQAQVLTSDLRQGFTFFMPIPAALNSSTATVLSNHLLVFTNSDALTRTPHFIEGSIQQLLFSCLLLQLSFFTLLPPTKGGKHYKRSHIRFMTFSHKERCTKTGVCHNGLVLLF